MALALTALTVAAQPGTDAKEYIMRFERANKAYADSPESVDALFDMAMLYFDNSLPLRNLPLAMTLASKAEANYMALIKEDKHSELTRLVRRGIVLATVQQLRQAVRDAALIEARQRNDFDKVETETYLDVFGGDEEIARIVRQKRLQRMLDSDMQAGTPQAYYHIIETYPHTNEAVQAETMLGTLASSLFENLDNEDDIDTVAARYPASPSVARAAVRKKSRMAFAIAAEENTVESYKAFLRRYPMSDEAQQARDILDNLLLMKYSTLRTAKEFADFADSNSDNELADNALNQIRRIINYNRDVQAARLYLSRYSLDEHYSQVYATYYGWYAEEGNGELLQLFEEENPGSPMRNALERDMDRAMLVDSVDLLEDFKEDDFPTYSTLIYQTIGKRISFVLLQRMVQQMVESGDYAGANNRIVQHEECFDNVMRDEYNELHEILTAPSSGTKVSEVGADMFNPCMNAADKTIYYTRVDGQSSSICYATLRQGKWLYGGTVKFSNDNNTGLKLFGFFDDGNKMLVGNNGDVWIAEREGEAKGATDKWRVSDILPYPVNTDYIETDAQMLSDGSGILLVSDRPGGQNLQNSGLYYHGDTALASDIYFIPFRQGLWGTPVNLGTSINTPYCERSPLMSDDLRTLYFITDGRGGLGYGDIYTATRTSAEDWTSWTTPKNIGREVNTARAETSVSFGKNENELLLTSRNSNRTVCRTATLGPKPAQSHSYDYTLDVLGMGDQEFRVRLADISQQSVIQVVEKVTSGSKLGMDMHRDKKYAVFSDAAGYFVPAVVIGPNSKPRQMSGYTYPVLVSMGKAVPLPAIEFEPSTATLTPVALLQVEQLIQFMRKTLSAVAEIVVDVEGLDDEQAYSMSLERGRAIKDRLTSMGIDAKRITVSAYGNTNVKRGGAEGVAIQFR